MEYLKNIIYQVGSKGILIISLLALLFSSVTLYQLDVTNKKIALIANYTNALLTGQAPLIKNQERQEVSALPLLVSDINELNRVVLELQANSKDLKSAKKK